MRILPLFDRLAVLLLFAMPVQERYCPIQLRPLNGEVTLTSDQWARAYMPLAFDQVYVLDVIHHKTRVADLAELQALCCTDWFTEARVEANLATLLELKLAARREIVLRSDWVVSWIEPARISNRSPVSPSMPRRPVRRNRSKPIAGRDYPAR
jgi:hypothetical protein